MWSASASALNSTTSPFGNFVEHSLPRVPQLMPAAESVPPTGLAIVNTCPDGRIHDTASITSPANATTIAATAATMTARGYRCQIGRCASDAARPRGWASWARVAPDERNLSTTPWTRCATPGRREAGGATRIVGADAGAARGDAMNGADACVSDEAIVDPETIVPDEATVGDAASVASD